MKKILLFFVFTSFANASKIPTCNFITCESCLSNDCRYVELFGKVSSICVHKSKMKTLPVTFKFKKCASINGLELTTQPTTETKYDTKTPSISVENDFKSQPTTDVKEKILTQNMPNLSNNGGTEISTTISSQPREDHNKEESRHDASIKPFQCPNKVSNIDKLDRSACRYNVLYDRYKKSHDLPLEKKYIRMYKNSPMLLHTERCNYLFWVRKNCN